MAGKTVKSYYLSENAIKFVEEYKNENRIGSDSATIEKILLDKRDNKGNITIELVRKIVEDAFKQRGINNIKNNGVNDNEVNDDEVIDEVMKNSIESMKDIMKGIK